jgi:Protein of unknown function (DUF1499)
VKIVGFLGILVLLGVVGLMAYVRLAPMDVAAWDLALSPRPAVLGRPSAEVVALPNAAYVDVAGMDLAELAARVQIWPRTQVLAGSAEAGRITWVTRTAFWGFPDVTTAEAGPAGLVIYARARFGTHDYGVNAARLRAWLAAP